METKLLQSRFLSLLLALFYVVVSPAVGPDTVTTVQPFLPPPYTIEANIDIVTPTCIMLTWELRPNTEIINGSRIATVKLWRIVLNVVSSNRREMVNELILPGSRSNITLGPFALGSDIRAEVYLKKFVTADGRTLEGESSFEGRPDPTIGLCSVDLPRNDKNCSKSFGYRKNPCSECVCISSAFTGPTCEDPTFKPHNVSAWPISDGSLHIQWAFNATNHLKSLERANLRLSNISLSVSEASSGILVMTDSVPINYQSEVYGYEVSENLSPGVEYDVVVGVGAARSSHVVVANSSAVRTFIPVTGVIEAGEGEALMLSGGAVPGVIVGVAVVSCFLASLASAVITAVCMRARAKRTRTATRQSAPIRALNPNSNLPLPPTRGHIPPNMERNPAYGQLSLSTGSNSTDYQNQNGESDGLEEEYDNTGGTTGTYTYITQY